MQAASSSIARSGNFAEHLTLSFIFSYTSFADSPHSLSLSIRSYWDFASRTSTCLRCVFVGGGGGGGGEPIDPYPTLFQKMFCYNRSHRSNWISVLRVRSSIFLPSNNSSLRATSHSNVFLWYIIILLPLTHYDYSSSLPMHFCGMWVFRLIFSVFLWQHFGSNFGWKAKNRATNVARTNERSVNQSIRHRIANTHTHDTRAPNHR